MRRGDNSDEERTNRKGAQNEIPCGDETWETSRTKTRACLNGELEMDLHRARTMEK